MYDGKWTLLSLQEVIERNVDWVEFHIGTSYGDKWGIRFGLECYGLSIDSMV